MFLKIQTVNSLNNETDLCTLQINASFTRTYIVQQNIELIPVLSNIVKQIVITVVALCI